MMRKIIIITSIVGCFLTAFFVNQAEALEEKNYSKNSLIIKVKDQSVNSISENLKITGQTLIREFDGLNKNMHSVKIESLTKDKNSPLYGSYKLTFSQDKNIKKLVKEYKKIQVIEYAEPEYYFKLNLFSPNDTYYSQQWNLDTINAPEAWDYDTTAPLYGGDSSAVVAIIDTGVAYENFGSFIQAPDLESTSFVSGYDLVENDTHPNDDNGHGTSIAEIIAATTNNSKGIAGVAFNVSIMPVRIANNNEAVLGMIPAARVAQGIDWAVANGADVINLSLGGETSSEILYDAVKNANDAGVIIVASTGNDGNDRIYYPAAYPEVIAVGSTNDANNLSSFSNYGKGLDLVAPGELVLAEYCYNPPLCNDIRLVYVSGTSQAAPHITAGAALLLSHGVNKTNIKAVLVNSAFDLGTSGYDTTFGYGLLDLNQAFYLAVNDTSGPSTILNTSPSEPDGNNGYFVNSPIVSLSATDDNGVSATYFRLDSENWQNYTSPFQLAEGKYLVEYYSLDNLNNTETIKSINIYVDTTTPTLTINTPFNNIRLNTRSFATTGSYDDTTSGVISLTIGLESVEINNSTFSKSLNLAKGKNTISYILEDRAGHQTSTSKAIFSYFKNNIIVGLGPGELPRVRGYNSSNQLTGEFLPYITSYHGGVNVVAGDIDNDGIEEIITAPISNGGPHVRVLNNRGEGISQFMAYHPNFRGGVNIASGDVDGDGQIEIITGAGLGGGPHIRIFDYQGNVKYQFFAYAKTFRGGVNVASNDLDGDGIAEIITGAGPSGGPHVRIFDYRGNVKGQFMAYVNTFKGGVNVASGDLDNDGKAEVITSPVASGGPHIRIFDISGNLKGQFMAYLSSFKGGVNISAGDYDNDGKYEIICGANSGGGPHVRIFDINGNLKSQFMGFSADFRGGVRITGFN